MLRGDNTSSRGDRGGASHNEGTHAGARRGRHTSMNRCSLQGSTHSLTRALVSLDGMGIWFTQIIKLTWAERDSGYVYLEAIVGALTGTLTHFRLAT